MRRIELNAGDQGAVVTTSGGRVVSYIVGGKEVIAGDEPVDRPFYRSALLAPWPNRVAGGAWTWRGQPLLLEVNEPDRGTALHGLVAYEEFTVLEHGPDQISLRHTLEPSAGYPFTLVVEAQYALRPTGLACALRARNAGSEPAPVGLGVHPYITARGPVDDVTLHLPANTLVKGDQRWEETARIPVAGTSLDLRKGRLIGAAEIDACWTDVMPEANGRVNCVVEYPDGDTVAVWGGPTTRYLVVYNASTLPGDAYRGSLAVEPNTAPANALRSAVDLTILHPGETFELTWGVQPSWR